MSLVPIYSNGATSQDSRPEALHKLVSRAESVRCLYYTKGTTPYFSSTIIKSRPRRMLLKKERVSNAHHRQIHVFQAWSRNQNASVSRLD